MKSIYIILLTHSLFIQGIAQNSESKIDSLKKAYTKNRTDIDKIKTLRRIGIQFEALNFDSAIYYHNLTIKIATEKNLTKEKAIGLINIGFAYKYGLNSEKSIDYLLKGLNVYQEINDKKGELDTYYNLGFFSGSFEKLSESILYYEKAVELGKLQKDTSRLAMIYNNLGLMHQYAGNYAEAIKNQILSLKIKELIDDQTLSFSHINIGLNYNILNKSKEAKIHFNKALLLMDSLNLSQKAICYNETGIALENQDSLDKAVKYYEKALSIYVEKNDNEGISRTYINLGELYKNSQLEKTEEYYKKAMAKYPANGSKKLKAVLLTNLAELEFQFYEQHPNSKNNHLKKCINYASEGFELAQKIGLLAHINKASELLYKSYHILGENKKSIHFAIFFITTKDSLFNIKKIRIIDETQVKYETEKKEQEIDILEKEQKLQNQEIKIKNIVIIGMFLITVLVLIFIITLAKNKKKLKLRNIEIETQKDEIETQAEELESSLENIQSLTKFKDELTQMLVHDLKNPITAIINLPKGISDNEHKKLTKYSAHKMLNLVMNILDVRKYEDSKLKLEKTEQNITELWKNAKQQLNYLAVQKNIKIIELQNQEINTKADKELIERVLINILSNSLKYTNANGEIKFYTEKTKNETIKIVIEDNGIGISNKDLPTIFKKYGQSGKKVNYSTGLGLTFCKIAIEEHAGEIGIESEEQKGTKIGFILPSTQVVTKKIEAKTNEDKIIIEKKEELKKFLPLLKETDIFQISNLKKIIEAMKNQNLGNEVWVKSFDIAISNCNNEQYESLLNSLEKA